MSVASVFIDEQDVSSYAVEGRTTRNLNRPSTAQVRLPMQYGVGSAGSLLKVYYDGVLHHHGRILLKEVSADENQGYITYNSTDPLEMWKMRPVRDPGQGFTSSCGKVSATDDPGDFSDPMIIQDFQTGPEIIEAACYASENIGLGDDDAEGPLFLAMGSFQCGGIDLTGAPRDWPMTMAQLATLMTSTGETDIVVTPIEVDGNGNYGQLDVYTGNYGDDLTTSVAFQYGMGAYNIRALRWNQDMTNMCNKLWYFLGPKVDQQHWGNEAAGIAGNITGDTNFAVPCGANQTGVDALLAARGDLAGAPGDSRGDYGVRMEIRMYDSGNEGAVALCLFQRLWLIEQWLRLSPQELFHITPTRDSEIGAFDIGDLVLVEATAEVDGGFSRGGRVYSYTIGWDAEESVPAITELQTSINNEGFDA